MYLEGRDCVLRAPTGIFGQLFWTSCSKGAKALKQVEIDQMLGIDCFRGSFWFLGLVRGADFEAQVSASFVGKMCRLKVGLLNVAQCAAVLKRG